MGSVATPPEGVEAEVVRVRSFDELAAKHDAVRGRMAVPAELADFEARDERPRPFPEIEGQRPGDDQQISGDRAVRHEGHASVVRS